jgi:hypothetical protein
VLFLGHGREEREREREGSSTGSMASQGERGDGMETDGWVISESRGERINKQQAPIREKVKWLL